MKKFMLIVLLSVFGSVCAMEKKVVMPSAEILNQRLSAEGFEYFVEKTEIDKRLGDRKLYPLAVLNAIDCALCDYDKIADQSMMIMMQVSKSELIKTILQDQPEAIENLKRQGTLK